MTCELPFMLNLPSEPFQVNVDGNTTTLLVQQECMALLKGKEAKLIGYFPISLVPQIDPGLFDVPICLRTIIQTTEIVEIPITQLTSVTKEERQFVIEANLQAKYIANHPSPSEIAFKCDQFTQLASEQYNGLDEQTKLLFAKMHIAKNLYRTLPAQDNFVKCVNFLVKSYMSYFKDPFAHEVSIDTLASGDNIRGIQCIVCDTDSSEILYRVHRIGKFPPITRKPWITHPENRIDEFRSRLHTSMDVDSVSLLQARSHHFIIVGAFRSAIIEASAALEICVAKKIRNYMTNKAKTDKVITEFLRKNWRFEERAKTILKQETGISACELDSNLWKKICDARSDYRDRIAHSDKEPDAQEAKDVVKLFDDMIGLITLRIPDALHSP